MAVEHVRSPGKTVYQAAQDLDLTETALRRWISEAERKSRPEVAGELSVEEREELRRLRRENQRLQMERDFLKSRGLLRQGEFIAFELIEAEKANLQVRMMCKLLDISRSGYYAWRSRKPSQRSQEEDRLKVSIQEAHQQGRGTYGSPRVTEELKFQGLTAGHHRVARLSRPWPLLERPQPQGSATPRSFNLSVAAGVSSQRKICFTKSG